MLEAILPTNETARLNAVHYYQIINTSAEQALDEFTALAAYICDPLTGLISIVAQQRYEFKSKVGFAACEFLRDVAFCAHTILEPELLIVDDAWQDACFVDNILVNNALLIYCAVRHCCSLKTCT